MKVCSLFCIAAAVLFATSPALHAADASNHAGKGLRMNMSKLRGESSVGVKNTSGCFEIKDVKDQERLTELDQKLAQLHIDIGSTPEVYQKQARGLIQSTIESLSPHARRSLYAQRLMHQTAAKIETMQADPKVLDAFLALEQKTVESHRASEKLSQAGAFTAIPRQNAANESTDGVLTSYNGFLETIEGSSILQESEKKTLRDIGRKMSQKTTKAVSQALDMSHEIIEVQKEITRGVRDTSFGVALAIGGGILTGGAGSGGGASLAVSGSARLGMTAMTVLRGAAGGAAFSGGTRLVTGNVGNFIRALSSEEDLFCKLAEENARNRALLYDEAAAAAARGAIYGGLFASGRLADWASRGYWTPEGSKRMFAGAAGLILDTAGSAVREVDRSNSFMTELSEARSSSDPAEKASVLRGLSGLNHNTGVSLFSEKAEKDLEHISDRLYRDGRELSEEKSKQVNDVLNGLISGLSQRAAINLDRDQNLPLSGERDSFAHYATGYFSNFVTVPEGMVSEVVNLNPLRTSFARKKIDTILDSK